MDNNNQLKHVFSSILEIDASLINDDLKYQENPSWDSINHMFLISEIENVFDIEIDADDILEMKSFYHTKEVLSKYNLDFNL